MGKSDPRVKIEWAKKHIPDLQAAIERFLQTSPYTVIAQDDPQIGLHYTVELVEQIPSDILCLTGDILHNLRSSLDHLLFRIMPSTVPWTRQHGFPIAAGATEYEARKLRKTKGLPQNLVQRIDAVKPFKGGNDILWRLNELNNIDKHRLLVALAVAQHRRTVDMRGMMIGMSGLSTPRFRYSTVPMQQGAVIVPPSGRFHRTGQVGVQDQYFVVMAFIEPEVLPPQPVFPLLPQFADLVEGIVAVFDDIP
jgi:hypothetical protein